MSRESNFTIEHITTLITDPTLPSKTLVTHLADLEAAANTPPLPDTPDLFSLYYSAYIFALLLDDDINEARFLCKRITSNLLSLTPSTISTTTTTTTTNPPLPPPPSPSTLTDYPLIPPTYTLLQSIYTRAYPTIYTTLLQPPTPWPPALQPLTTRLLDHIRRKTFRLLSHAYTTITPSRAATYLGFLDEDEHVVVEKLTAEGWVWDEDLGLLKPVVREEEDVTDEDLALREEGYGGVRAQSKDGKGGDGRIKRLTGLVTHLTDY